MIERLKSYWLYGSIYCSLELTTQNENEIVYGLTVRKKNEAFDNVTPFKSSLEIVENNLRKNQHCHLTINTDQVLIEAVSNFEEESDIISQAFPNLSSTDFYSEILKQGDIAIIAICRKEYVNERIKQLEKKGLSVIGFSLGFSDIKNLLPLLKKDLLQTSRQQLFIESNGVVSFDSIENLQIKNYTIEDLSINSNHLLSLSGVPNYLTKKQDVYATRHRQKVFFQKGFYAGMGFLVVIWIVNLLLFTTYKGQLKELRGESSASITQKEAYQIKLKEVNQKEKVVQNILQTTNSKSAFYLNRVSASLPETIQLSQLAYQPITKAIQQGKEINYQKNMLIVSGISTDTQIFNNWIEKLENFNWVYSISVSNYTQKTNSKTEFEIKLSLFNETTN